jgi:succinate dehydrogenase / fumarate reductase flavoprotein subunit
LFHAFNRAVSPDDLSKTFFPRCAMDSHYDAVIVGAGLAGLRAAIELGGQARVAVISKVFATRSHSGAAQGGIGAAIGNEEEDRWEWHMFDTVKGSDYLGDQDAIEIMAKDAARTIYELEHLGVPFNRTQDGRIAQRAFGGHTRDFGKAPVKRGLLRGGPHRPGHIGHPLGAEPEEGHRLLR